MGQDRKGSLGPSSAAPCYSWFIMDNPWRKNNSTLNCVWLVEDDILRKRTARSWASSLLMLMLDTASKLAAIGTMDPHSTKP